MSRPPSLLRFLSFPEIFLPFNMASLPDKVLAALELRSSPTCLCPADVESVLSSISFFRKTGAAPSAVPGARFGVLTGASSGGGRGFPRTGGGGWRGGEAPSQNVDGDGFQVWTGRHRKDRIIPHATSHYERKEDAHPRAPAPAPAAGGAGALAPSPASAAEESAVAKFSSAAVKTGVDMEERLLARVKGKINKIGFSTYDATKAFMQQILDSDETGFLDELMKFVFQKAATESTFCPLYAKLLHELADEFGHLRVVMHALFNDYTAIFSEMDTAPDVGTEDYKAFVEAQERKKFRRGYSQFVAELVKLGEADVDSFRKLIFQIVSVLEESFANPDRTLTCEEYIDCLANMCTSASNILSAASWSADIVTRLDKIVKKPRSESPGLSNKGRFAVMDLLDFAKRGWK